MERANKLAESLLDAMDRALKGEVLEKEKHDQLFGTRGVLAVLSKLIQLLKEIQPEGALPEEMSTEDMEVLKGWLASRSD